MRLNRLFTHLLLLSSFALISAGQEVLTNDTILKLSKAGLSDELIVPMIASQATNFSLKADDMLALKQAGVSEKVLVAMVRKGAGAVSSANPAASVPPVTPATGTTPSAPSAPNSPGAPGPVSEVGVFCLKGGSWTEMMPEVVNWKTGGVMKSLATAGVMKGDINGRIAGGHARTGLTNPARILIYTPEGTAITEYQLIRLREKDDAREFRTVTGGVFHVSGGANRDLIQVEHKKIASRTFELVLSPTMASGEYGILPPGGSMTSGASAQLGKMYTFRILE